MMKSRFLILAGVILLLITNCTKPYTPKTITNTINYLVVEGVINTGSNTTTTIVLSRTVPLNAGVGTNPEKGASISIQDENGPSYPLLETASGVYVSDILNLDNTHKYRLNINCTDGKNYVSDYIAPMQTPAIDSIGFTIKSNGMQVYANTHDPNNSTHYYRWNYTETWQFYSKFFSNYITTGSAIVIRTPDQYVYQCWGNSLSTDIVLGSSAKLTQDVIYQAPITFIESTSEKIEARYSILVTQYALSADGYDYFEQLRKNTEELGGIFDPQPSQLTGNVHCITNPSIPAIGYITAGTIQQKRVFINSSQLPHTWVVKYPYDCQEDTAFYVNPRTTKNDVQDLLIPLHSPLIPTDAIYSGLDHLHPSGYKYSSIDCVDCSLRGTLIKPSFW